MAVEQLQHFAFGDGVGGVGQDAHDFHVVDRDHHLEGARIEEVADQHAGGVAEQGVGGFAAAPQFGFVDHVVVQQGGGVDEFDYRGEFVMGASLIIEAAGRQQHQRRAQPLAAAVDDVFGDLADEHHVGIQALADDMIDGTHVVGQVGLQALQGHDSGLA